MSSDPRVLDRNLLVLAARLEELMRLLGDLHRSAAGVAGAAEAAKLGAASASLRVRAAVEDRREQE